MKQLKFSNFFVTKNKKNAPFFAFFQSETERPRFLSYLELDSRFPARSYPPNNLTHNLHYNPPTNLSLSLLSSLLPTQNPRLLDEGTTERPDYQRCIAISTRAALKYMVPPGALVMLAPLVAGTFFGVMAVCGLLTGKSRCLWRG